ncbi:MAG TPA: hypothetical protein V6D29_24305 [Leptolyngbyaceae cyanobacterium]
MKKLDYASLVLGVASLLWFLSLPGYFAVAQPKVVLETTPALTEVVPSQTPVQLRLVAKDERGQPLQANAQLSLQAPKPTPWFTSDFPWVEGTTLLNLTAPLEDGELTWSQVMPIRGQYALTATFTPTQAGAFAPFQQQLTLGVRENQAKYRNALVLVAILIAIGGFGGWVIGRGAVSQSAGLPHSVQQLLLWGIVLTATALLVLNISAEMASSHSDSVHAAPISAQGKNPAVTAKLEGEQFAFVGQPAHQSITVKSANDQALPIDLKLQVEVVDLESQEAVFSYSNWLKNPNFAWDWQFYDAAPHQVRATLSSASLTTQQPIELGHVVEVQGKEPPLTTRFITLGYWLLIFTGAMLAGYRWATHSSSKPAS